MAVTTFAAIDIGSYEISMKIFEFSKKIGFRELNDVRYRLEIGKGAYSRGRLERGAVGLRQTRRGRARARHEALYRPSRAAAEAGRAHGLRRRDHAERCQQRSAPKARLPRARHLPQYRLQKRPLARCGLV